MRRLIATSLMLLGGCSTFAQSENPTNERAVADAMSICLSAVADVQSSESLALALGWELPEPATKDMSDKSLYLINLPEDPTLKGYYYLVPKNVLEDASGEVLIRELSYPHLEIRNCVAQLSVFTGAFDVNSFVPGEHWVGQFNNVGDDPSTFGDASQIGLWSFTTDEGDIVTVDVARAERLFFVIQVTGYRQLSPAKE